MAEQPQAQNAEKLLNDLQHSEEAYVRKTAAEQLGEQATNDDVVIIALKNTAQSDENKYAREAAYNSLVKLGVENLPLTENHPTNAAEKPSADFAIIGLIAEILLFPVLLALASNGQMESGAFLILLFGIFIFFVGESIFIGIRIRNKWKINGFRAWFGSLIFNIIVVFILGVIINLLPPAIGDYFNTSIIPWLILMMTPQIILILISRPK